MGNEALAYLYGGRRARGVPVPVAREKSMRGREASREIVVGFAQQAYADRAYPHQSVGAAQLEGALAAMRNHDKDDDKDRFVVSRSEPGRAHELGHLHEGM